MYDFEQAAHKSLRNIVAERTNRIVVWVGSGLSREGGLPTWCELRQRLCSVAKKDAQELANEQDKRSLLSQLKHAEQMQDYWVSFEMLKELMGRTSYCAAIREAFIAADRCSIPETYELLWHLPLDGVLNLNLDRLATRAHSEKFGGRLVTEFTGRQAGEHMHVLKGSTPFIVNLHGIVADESSWVLTQSELTALFKNMGYLEFIRSCINVKTLLFIGISPDDKAVGEHLDILKREGVDFGAHYWITDRRDRPTRQWAERAGLRTIYYSAEDGSHNELKAFCADLRRFVPQEMFAPPVQMEHLMGEASVIPSPDELKDEASEERVRTLLNAHAKALLQGGDQTAYDQYAEFCKRYDQAVYRAWYVTTDPPNNKLFGYSLVEEIAEGAFGRVFRAEATDGTEVALKLLKAEVRRKPEMLQSFRRGVRSMRILSSHDVQGMVAYREASEIPACAVMDFIDGPDLRQAVESRYCDDWAVVLRIAVDLANIIRRAHLLPERVLHRDIRPANIMLAGYFVDPVGWQVLVLDFDLSWHMGAMEVSVLDRSTLSGFLAPEQVDRRPNASTRNAAVDSFGLGMTLYYVRTGKEPQYLQHLHRNWHETIFQAVNTHSCANWHSLPNRYARLIENATRDVQAERWDMSQIEGELELLKEAYSYPQSVQSTELLAEEIAARTSRLVSSGTLYEWNPDTTQACISLPSGVQVQFIPHEARRVVEIAFSWMNPGTVIHKNIRKYLPKACERAISELHRTGWESKGGTARRRGNVDFGLEIPVNRIQKDLGLIAQALSRATSEFTFK